MTNTDAQPYSIDRSLLATIKKRFLQFNKQRLERTLDNLAPRQQLFLQLMPLLFHTNHPVLPGYVSSDACCGIINFQPDKELLKAAKQLSKSFRYKKFVNHTPAIHAIFLMGSIGTIGQSHSSDLDFWVCHDPKLSPSERQQLQQRCDGIEAWGNQVGLSVCFFPMNAEDFCKGKPIALSDDSSGSTQHKLLLDEFYRTAIHLAGQYPLWWFVHPDAEQHYPAYSRDLISKRFLRETEVIDFGGLDNIPPQEFISAATWQLYKAIHSPYKSLMKLLLLGAYVRRHNHNDILSIALKQAIYDNKISADSLDPYLLLLHSLSDYLERQNLPHRLELIRRSFYFKVNKPLSKTPKTTPPSWQRDLLRELVSSWQWPQDKIEYLDQRHAWNASQVMQEKQLLISELLNGYQLLSDYAQSQHTPGSHDLNRDVAILGRKLYAAFERKSGKIELINPGISRDISEQYLTFYPKTNSSGVDEWHVSTGKKHEAMDPQQRLHSCPSLIELITWCYCNEILTTRTNGTIKHHNLAPFDGGHSGNRPVNPIQQALEKWLPIKPSAPFKPNFEKLPEPVNLLIVVNELASNDDNHLSTEFPSANPLSAGTNQINLLNDIHLVCHNSWGEISVHSSSDSPLDFFVRQIFSLFSHADSLANCKIHFHGQQGNHTNSLKLRLEQIMRQLDSALMQLPDNQQGLFIVASGETLLCFEKRGAHLHVESLHKEIGLLDKLSQPHSQYTAIHIDPLSLSAGTLAAIFRVPVSRAIQVFYSAQGNMAEVLILDERNTLTRYHAPFRDEQSLLRPLHRFIRSVINRLQLSGDSLGDFGIYPVEFYELQNRGNNHFSAQRTRVATELQNLKFFNMQAIAEPGRCELSNFSIYCNQQQFQPAHWGDSLFRQVARQILSLRHHGDRYPCYLTDLDLGDSPESLVGDKPLQTAHFMLVKNRLEQLLNRALQEI